MYADINAGSGILAQRGAVLSDMNATRAKMSEQLNNNLQHLGQVFKDFGEALEKKEQLKKENEFRQAQLDAEKDYRQKSLDLQQEKINLEKQKLPTEIKNIQADTANKYANAGRVSWDTSKDKKDYNTAQKISKQQEEEAKKQQEQLATLEAAKQNTNSTTPPPKQPQTKGSIFGFVASKISNLGTNNQNTNEKFFNRQ